MNEHFVTGDWKAICDQCGRQTMASKMTKRWDGLMVHADPAEGCFETRHPQDLIRAPKPEKPIPWSRPEATDRFVGPTYVGGGNQETTIPSGTFTTNNQTL